MIASPSSSSPPHSIEPLEARIAPALVLVNPLADIIAGSGSKGASVDLSEMFDIDAEHPNHTLVRFVTSYINPDAPTVPQDILIELFDDEAPLTVQNFLNYITAAKADENYEGTFFHRAISGFVLQGGGFDAMSRSHIDVDLPVHNEFGATRSNVAGTIAMAKVEGDPNSATSEFFFNLGNNASNLDNQNGGFTVFGRVLGGMDVINAIVALPKASAGNSGSDTPVQNYDADPDNNPNTPPPPVKKSSLVTIEDIDVINEKGNAAGITFRLPASGAITDLNGAPSDLLTASIVGTDLQLKYNTDKAGVVKVKVEATQDGTTVTDEFLVTIKPNLVATIVGDTLSPLIVGGDSGKAKIRVGNNGAATLDSNVTVKFFLSTVVAGVDPQGILFDDTDQLIGQITSEHVVLAGGKTKSLVAPIDIPQKLVDAEKIYRVIAKVESSLPGENQLFTDDDNAVNGRQHLWSNRFGDFEIQNIERSNVSLSYVEADGNTIKLAVKGRGTGTATLDAGNVNVTVAGTNPRSVFEASSSDAGARVALHNIEIIDPLGVARLGSVDLDGFFTAASGARSIVLGDVTSNSTFSIGSGNGSRGVALTFAHVEDLVLESLMPIKRLRASDWIDTQGDEDAITAPSIRSLLITGNGGRPGDFEADVTLSDARAFAHVRIAGAMNDSTITTSAAIGTLNVGAMHDSNIFAGVTHRVATAEELQQAATIKSIIVDGVTGGAAFTNSNIVAQTIGRVVLTGVDGQSAADEFGIVADRIGDYLRTAGAVRVHHHDLENPAAFTPPGEADRVGNYVLRIV